MGKIRMVVSLICSQCELKGHDHAFQMQLVGPSDFRQRYFRKVFFIVCLWKAFSDLQKPATYDGDR